LSQLNVFSEGENEPTRARNHFFENANIGPKSKLNLPGFPKALSEASRRQGAEQSAIN